jgi:hypothetical protein
MVEWLVGSFWRLSDLGQALVMGGFILGTVICSIVAGNGLAYDSFGPRKSPEPPSNGANHG